MRTRLTMLTMLMRTVRSMSLSPVVLGLAAALTASACVGPEDLPSRVHDLRVLGVQLESPELMAPQCPDFAHPQATDPSILLPFLQPIAYRALIVDPKGEGRSIDWELYACARQGDRDCSDRGDRVELSRGTTVEGELTLTLEGLAFLKLPGEDPDASEDDRFLLERVVELDTYRGLGGIRVPLVLHLKAGDEEIWASKLMVFNCQFFPSMKQNVNPELPGMTLKEEDWPEGEVPLLEGPGPFEMEPLDFSALQEPFVMPSFELQPVESEERWELAWYADLGQFSFNETGGQELGTGELRHRNEWSPPEDAKEQDVRFWFVVRDGRGGLSWISRTAHYKP